MQPDSHLAAGPLGSPDRCLWGKTVPGSWRRGVWGQGLRPGTPRPVPVPKPAMSRLSGRSSLAGPLPPGAPLGALSRGRSSGIWGAT